MISLTALRVHPPSASVAATTIESKKSARRAGVAVKNPTLSTYQNDRKFQAQRGRYGRGRSVSWQNRFLRGYGGLGRDAVLLRIRTPAAADARQIRDHEPTEQPRGLTDPQRLGVH